MLNIVIPMAGAGTRFAKEGFKNPKPLILVHGIPMIKVVIDNLKPNQKHRFIFICQRAHVREYGLREKFVAWSPMCEIIEIDGITEGAACTVLKAKSLIDNNDHLMVANSDQYVDVNVNDYLNFMSSKELDGLIMTMKSNDPKWSFVRINSQKLVTGVVEKEVVSDEATVGIYNFKKGADFVRAAEQMIRLNLRVNNEFYTAPVYNQLIEEHYNIGIYNIGSEYSGMYGLGTPDDLRKFLFSKRSGLIKG